ncbi:AfsR/SARP family transcriptional regulator [Streptomyces sp. JNUCC 64]
MSPNHVPGPAPSTDDAPRLNILGADGVHLSEREAERLPPQTSELLTYLALRSGQQARRPAVTAALWPNAAEHTGRRRLSKLLWRSTRCLPPDTLRSTGESIALGSRVTTDWGRANLVTDRVLKDGALPHAHEVELLSKPLGSTIQAEWIEDHRHQWDQRRVRGLRRAGAAFLSFGRPEEAAQIASSLTRWQPLDEPSHELLLRSYLSMGAPGHAERHLREFTRRLRRELGVEPSPNLIALVRDPAPSAAGGGRGR